MQARSFRDVISARGLLLATSGLAFSWAATAQAQDASAASSAVPSATTPAVVPEPADQDIVVTARGRGELLLQAPVAITAVSGAQLVERGIKNTTDLSALVPTLLIDTTGSGAGGTISLRGISTTSSQAGFDQAVSIAIDGVQTGRAQTLHGGLFDLEQIEVLKGPQALFFGKNSPGGVVSLRTANPTSSLQAYLRGGYEFVGDEYKVEGAVSSPLSESLGVRVAVSYTDLDGYFRNTRRTPVTAAENPVFGALDGGQPALGDPRPGNSDLIGRVTLAYAPAGSGLNVNLKVSADRFRSDGPNAGGQVVNCAGAPFPNLAFGALAFLDSAGECKTDNKFTRTTYNANKVAKWPFAKSNPYADIDTYLGILNASYDFDNVTLTSTSGYLDLDSKQFDNYDYTSFSQIAAAEHERYKSFSQELRLASTFDGPINFVVGGYYQHTNLFFFNAASIAPGADDGSVSGAANVGKYQSWERPGRTRGNTYSAFGQLRWNIASTLELAGGVRYTRETKNSYTVHTYVNSSLAALLLPPGITYTDRFRGNNWSPEATLTYRPTPDLTFFGGYRTGYKSGGFGLTTVLTRPTTAASLSFDPERIKGFEVGAKGRLLDRLLTFNLSAYTYRYSNLQLSQFDGRTLSFSIVNAGAARIKGAEFELSAHPFEGLTLSGTAAYNSARYIRFATLCYPNQTLAQGCVNGTQSLNGRSLNQAPRWTGTAGIDYVTPISDFWNVGASGNLRATSKYETATSDDPFAVQHNFTTYDAGLRVTSRDDRYNLALIGRNLSNKYYIVQSNSKPGGGAFDQIGTVPQRGRQVMLEFTYRYR